VFTTASTAWAQGGENTFEAGAGLHNFTGRAEHLVATAEYGTQSSSQASLSYEQPRIFGLPAVVRAAVLLARLVVHVLLNRGLCVPRLHSPS